MYKQATTAVVTVVVKRTRNRRQTKCLGDMEAVRHAIRDGPHEKYGELPLPPLTSHDYGWWPANTFEETHDEADRERFNHRLKRPNYWY